MLNELTWSREQLARCIAFVNGKGGVGKTSLVANLAGMYAAANYRVLVIDLDPQGNCGNDLGYVRSPIDDNGEALVSAISNRHALVPVRDVRSNLDVAIGGEQLDDLALGLGELGEEGVLALAASLAQIAEDYDLVLIDCPPGTRPLQELGLAAARWIVIPTKSDDGSRAGLRRAARVFATVRDEWNPALELLGVVLFGFTTSAKRIDAMVRADLATDIGQDQVVFGQSIRHAEATGYYARRQGKLVQELEVDLLNGPKWYERLRAKEEGAKAAKPAEVTPATAANVAKDYQALGEELIDRLVEAEKQGVSV